MGDGKVQAVQDNCDLLAVLGGKNVVEEGGFACAEVACSSRVISGYNEIQREDRTPVTMVIGTFFPMS